MNENMKFTTGKSLNVKSKIFASTFRGHQPYQVYYFIYMRKCQTRFSLWL